MAEDLETGRSLLDHFEDYDFVIPNTKHASMERLERWRKWLFFRNAFRRLRYTLNLERVEEQKESLLNFRAHTQAMQPANCFKEAAKSGSNPSLSASLLPSRSLKAGDFYGIGIAKLVSITRDCDFVALQQLGGVKGLAHILETDILKGLDGDDIDLLARRTVFGSNSYSTKIGRSFWRFLWEACHDWMLVFLLVAVVASLALGKNPKDIDRGWYDGGSIAFAVVVVIILTAVCDFKQYLQFKNLNEEKPNIHLEVIRGGRQIEASVFDVVVGDVLPLKIGNRVAADGILISGHSLTIDESCVSGEGKIVHKDSKLPFLMSGCKVLSGCGSMLVTSVGINTRVGMLMSTVSVNNGEETPLQVQLNGVALGTVMISFIAVVLVLIGPLLRRCFPDESDPSDGELINLFIAAVTVGFATAGEGLPLAFPLTLAYSVGKMVQDKILVRRFSSCELMGFATTICCNEPGTLTMNKMTVVEAYVCGKKIDLLDSNLSLSPQVFSLLIEGIAQNTNGSVVSEGNKAVVYGSPTEKAILDWGLKLGMNFCDVKSSSSVIRAIPLDSKENRGGVALKLLDSNVRVHWMGAAEIVLANCRGYINEGNDIVEMDGEHKEKFLGAIEKMAAQSLRCIAIAYRSVEITSVPTQEETLAQWPIPEDDLLLLAIVGIQDPVRKGVKDAVQLCIKAGVKIRMVTADNMQTARAIALECGILDSKAESCLIEGKVFRNLSDVERIKISEKISVMGMSSPDDKLQLIRALRKRGHVVAVTTGGTNDVPALHEADIGLAMGIQGTEVAKESSDIMILDDNFASIVKLVRWGRTFYGNVRKIIQFQLTVIAAIILITILAGFFVIAVPLNAMQLLWVNLITDTLGTLALATEPLLDHMMHEPLVVRRTYLVTNTMWRNIWIQALYQAIVVLGLHFRCESILDLGDDTKDKALDVINTLIFNAFVFCQIFNEFNARKPDSINIFEGLTKSYHFTGIMGVTVMLQVFMIHFLGKLFSTVQLSWSHWLISILIGFVSWPIAAVGKLIPVPETCFEDEESNTGFRRGFMKQNSAMVFASPGCAVSGCAAPQYCHAAILSS